MSGFILTLLLLLISFLLKLYINRKPKGMDIVKTLTEIPVDIMFTSTAFIIAYRIAEVGKLIKEEAIITKELDMNINFIFFIIYLCVTILVIVLWRYSKRELNKSVGLKKGLTYFGIAFVISFSALIFALTKLYGVV